MTARAAPGSDAKPSGYYQTDRLEMLPFVPRTAQRILELGCGEGTFGGHLKRVLGCEAWGIEIEAAAAAVAASRLDQVLTGDIGALIDELPDATFDVVVCNDVLEHLVDPWGVLERVKPKLAPGGVVVSSIPNIRFFSTFYALLAWQSWEYEPSGILDVTHLRFFTSRSIRTMFERLGYDVLVHQGINPAQRLPLRYTLANRLLRGRLDDMRYVQFATVARPVPERPGDPRDSRDRHGG